MGLIEHLRWSASRRWLIVYTIGYFHLGLRLSCFVSSSCATDVIHSKTVFHSSSRETNILFSFIITNCFNNCYTTFPWLPVSNILDFKFYCNRKFCLLWKWSQVKEIEILVHNVFKSCVINFPSKWSFWLFYSQSKYLLE